MTRRASILASCHPSSLPARLFLPSTFDTPKLHPKPRLALSSTYITSPFILRPLPLSFPIENLEDRCQPSLNIPDKLSLACPFSPSVLCSNRASENPPPAPNIIQQSIHPHILTGGFRSQAIDSALAICWPLEDVCSTYTACHLLHLTLQGNGRLPISTCISKLRICFH